MSDFLIYIAEVSILMSIFYLFYRYLYFKLVYFEWSRYFFLVALVISIIIPFMPEVLKMGTIFHPNEISDGAKINLESNYYISIDRKIEEENYFDATIFAYVFFTVWISGFIVKTVLFVKRLLSIIKLISKSKKIKIGKYKIITLASANSAFSFFYYIFINEQLYDTNGTKLLSEEQLNQIIEHEKLHALQLHTIDNLIFELYEAVFWFNPVSRKISDSIKEIHEFIVDIKLTKNKNKPDYSRLIVKLASKLPIFSAVSSFSKDEILNRVKIISNPESHRIRKKRFIASIPVLAVVIFAFMLIVSSVNAETGLFDKNKKKFCRPLKKGTYIVLTPFFINKKVYDKSNPKSQKMYKISHPEITYRVKTKSAVYAIADGKVVGIDTAIDMGLKSLRLTLKIDNRYKAVYKNLFKINAKINEAVNKDTKIAETGAEQLYPTISLMLLKDTKPINPKYCY